MMATELTVVIPTYNERANIELLVERIDQCLGTIAWEAIFVDDDSPDGTADLVRSLCRRDPRIRCIQRLGRRGLASACIEGMASSSSPYLAVLDADLQHDETLLPAMLQSLQANEADLAIGSRYIAGGGTGNWDGTRRKISRLATTLGNIVLKQPVADPMSGFFMIRSDKFWRSAPDMSGRGFKILLDLIVSCPISLRIKELPYVFKPRLHGESKLDSTVVLEYLLLLLDKFVGRILPVRFLLFVMVGALGAIIHLTILGVFHIVHGKTFWVSQVTASLFAMVLNFALNNLMTYRDKRLRGSKLVTGFFIFVLACSIGAFTSAQVGDYFFVRNVPWWLSGLLGASIASVWNFAVSSQFVWRRRSKRKR